MKPLSKKVALVTGSGRGIGAEIAVQLAAQGAKVLLTSRTLAEIEAVSKKINATHGTDTALALAADVSSEADVQNLFKTMKAHFGRLDILVNNAGYIDVAEFLNSNVASWDKTMAINVRGPYLCSLEAFRMFKQQGGGGTILNFSSLSGIKGTEKFKGMTSYVASKHAVIGLTESLAVEGRELGIRVNCIAPGAVNTVMLRQAAPHLKTKTEPADVAKVAVFLCDETQSGSLNGAVIEIHSNL
jgi:3-oxoacyl-[acyl-carrier protein] reductase